MELEQFLSQDLKEALIKAAHAFALNQYTQERLFREQEKKKKREDRKHE